MTVTVNEVEALFDLFKRLSSSIIDDGCIHKVYLFYHDSFRHTLVVFYSYIYLQEEFQLALFRNSSKQNLLASRVHYIYSNLKFAVLYMMMLQSKKG